eukprot:97881_1
MALVILNQLIAIFEHDPFARVQFDRDTDLTSTNNAKIINKPPKQDTTAIRCWTCGNCKTINNLALTLRKYKMLCCLPVCSSPYDPVSTETISSTIWNLCPHQVSLEYKLCHLCYVEEEQKKAPVIRTKPTMKLIKSISEESQSRCSLLIDGYMRDVIRDIHMFPTSVFKIIALYFEPFKVHKEKCDTTQGRTYIGFGLLTGKKCIIQEAWRQLVQLGQSRNGKRCLPLNWLLEREFVLSAGQSNDCPSSIIEGFHAWEDEHCHYYATEYWHGDLFDFISYHHQAKLDKELKESLRNGTAKTQQPAKMRSDWMRTCGAIFKQICEATHWIHSKGYCHLGLALEHIAIDKELKIKLIRFDMMKEYKNVELKTTPWSKVYASPELYAKQVFDGQMADIWSLGICLFMMLIGGPPFKAPKRDDRAFQFIIHGRLMDVLRHWKRLCCVTDDALDLLNRILKPEGNRITLDQVMNHPFLTR